jgi:xylulokinase
MDKDILAVDVGTSAMKIGVFSSDLEKKRAVSKDYQASIVGVCADIDPEIWWQTFTELCSDLGTSLSDVDSISFSVTSPGLTPMDENGRGLGPAILFLDTRSLEEAKWIRKVVGEEFFLTHTMNLPAPGGSSLASILWIKNHQPDVYADTYKFGHTNTFFIKRLTGNWIIDPSTVSLTGLYNSLKDDLSYNTKVLAAAGIDESKLPTLMYSHQVAGEIRSELATELGLPADCKVYCGGNDAVLAAYSAGLNTSGQIIDICGTCEIIAACLDQPLSSPDFNVRCHVIPGKWMSFFVLNAGGIAYDWFHETFCRDMDKDTFYGEFIHTTLQKFMLEADQQEELLPSYLPYLQGSRYSLENCSARFDGFRTYTSREDFFLALLKGNFQYLNGHIETLSKKITIENRMITTGGGAKIKGIELARKRWLGDFDYEYRDQSSLLGAAMLTQANRF